MISKEDWEVAHRNLIADGRKRLGPPPAFEEVEALSNGKLPEEEAERVRELLSVYPDLLRVLTEPFPANADDVLTAEELSADLENIRARTRRVSAPHVTAPRKLPGWRLAIAAGIAIAVVGSFAVWRVVSTPRALMTQVIYPDRNRGIERRGVPAETPVHLFSNADYMLQPVFDSERPYREYSLELFDLSTVTPRRVWLRSVTPQRDRTYPIRLSTGDLEPGLYRLVLYGMNETVEPLAEYTIRLSTP